MNKTFVGIYFLLFAFCLLLFCNLAMAQAHDSLSAFNNIQGTLKFNQRYCGGARPSEELLAMFDSIRPLPNTMVYLARKKGGKFIYKLFTDKNGNFHKRIRAGKYFVYMSKQYDHEVLFDFNSHCGKWMKHAFAEVEIINGENKTYSLLLRFGCDPCSPPRP